MAKGDDVKMRKRNKAIRKKLHKDPSSVSTRVAAIIAAKKRRQSGKRRKCQGMCFSLPTLDDPFNDGHGKVDVSMYKTKRHPHQFDKGLKKTGDMNDQEIRSHRKEKGLDQKELKQLKKPSSSNLVKRENSKLEKRISQSLVEDVQPSNLGYQNLEISGCPSNFFFMCFNTIRDSLLGDGKFDEELDEPLFVNSWGLSFWKLYSMRQDILETSVTGASIQQIAWMASTVADSISEMEKEGISTSSPFMLYLVSSQEKAVEIRSICKPLKASGIHTVILHPGTSVQHQVDGLKSCEPEFLVATPERLWELVSLKAIDVTGVSFLVVDGIDYLYDCLDVVENIKNSISRNTCTIVFQGSCSGSSVRTVGNILREPYHTLSLDKSVNSSDDRF